MKPLKMQLSILLILIGISSQCYAAEPVLCPRGEYTLTKSTDNQWLLQAKVTLPTSGYATTLKTDAKLTKPPMVKFLCKRPTGIVMQVLTEYAAEAKIPSGKIRLRDKVGEQVLTAE
jgi:hypothetical protein